MSKRRKIYPEAKGLPPRKELMKSWAAMYQARLNYDLGRVQRLIDQHLAILGDKSKITRERITQRLDVCEAMGTLESALAKVKEGMRAA